MTIMTMKTVTAESWSEVLGYVLRAMMLEQMAMAESPPPTAPATPSSDAPSTRSIRMLAEDVARLALGQAEAAGRSNPEMMSVYVSTAERALLIAQCRA